MANRPMTDAEITSAAYALRTKSVMTFASRDNRDRVAKAARADGRRITRHSGYATMTTNYVRDLFAPDKGLANDWYSGTLYFIEAA